MGADSANQGNISTQRREDAKGAKASHELCNEAWNSFSLLCVLGAFAFMRSHQKKTRVGRGISICWEIEEPQYIVDREVDWQHN